MGRRQVAGLCQHQSYFYKVESWFKTGEADSSLAGRTQRVG